MGRWLISCLKTNHAHWVIVTFSCVWDPCTAIIPLKSRICALTDLFLPSLEILISSVLWSLLPGLLLCHTPVPSSLNSSTQQYTWSNDGTSWISVTSILHHRVYVHCLLSMYLLFKLGSILPRLACCKDTEMGERIPVAFLPVECKLLLFCLYYPLYIYVYTRISLGSLTAVLC